MLLTILTLVQIDTGTYGESILPTLTCHVCAYRFYWQTYLTPIYCKMPIKTEQNNVSKYFNCHYCDWTECEKNYIQQKNNNPISIVISVITHFTTWKCWMNVVWSDSLFDQNNCLVTNFNTFYGFVFVFLNFNVFMKSNHMPHTHQLTS